MFRHDLLESSRMMAAIARLPGQQYVHEYASARKARIAAT